VLKLFLALTFLLGFLFVGLQATEYREAYHELNLKLSSGVYGSTFFMLTGFHGLHVTIGAIMLLVIWLRVLKGHFTPRQHFAFELSPGTGTSSTSCGWVSLSSSTGCRSKRRGAGVDRGRPDKPRQQAHRVRLVSDWCPTGRRRYFPAACGVSMPMRQATKAV
jgi:hypothetical protein